MAALFSSLTEAAVIYGGFLLAVNLFRFMFTPVTYFQIGDYALQVGQRRPGLEDMMAQSFGAVLEAGCRFVAPYIVYRSVVKRREEAALPDAGGAQRSGDR